jgi:isochorismate hydrolase
MTQNDLWQVDRKLSPETQQRWDELLEKRDDAILTTSEYAELLQLTEVVEELNLQRMTALSQLAQERGVDLRTMVQQLN